ncbi:MAG: hypothetical protein ACUVRV_08735 [Cyanobacteriota bacterium]
MPPRSSSSGSTSFPFFEAKSAASADQLESSLPLGQRLVRAGLISQSHLAQALREQQQNHLKLGEVCLERGWLQMSDLYRFISSRDLSLGEILMALGYLDFEQLRVALAQQRRYGRKLGEILTWKGWVEQAALDHALDVQVQLQQLASPNAWEALQPFLAVHPKPGGKPTLETPVETDPLQILQREEPDSGSSSTPTSAGAAEASAQPMTLADYRRQVEALRLQIQLQEQEWDRILADINQQVAEFQSQYQQRIQKLEATIRLQQAEIEQQTTLRQNLIVFQEQLQRLETDLANARAAEQKAQQQLQIQQDSYQSQLEQLQEHIQILQKRQLDSIPTSAVADLQAQLESALQQVQQLQSERDQLRQLRSELQLLQALQGIPQATTSTSTEISAPIGLTEEHAEGTESLQLIHLQAQVASLQQQLLQASAALQSWQERYAQLQQKYDIQTAQLQQLQTEMAGLITANREYEAQIAQQQEHLRQSQAQIAQMTVEKTEMEQHMAKLEGSLQICQTALEQARQ